VVETLSVEDKLKFAIIYHEKSVGEGHPRKTGRIAGREEFGVNVLDNTWPAQHQQASMHKRRPARTGAEYVLKLAPLYR
jgi:hypothetical protein